MSGCLVCENTDLGAAAPVRERIVRTDHWRLAHAFGTDLPGWLVLVPTVHAERLTDLVPAAADELGGLLTAASRALEAVTGCVKTYVALFAEAEGFTHLHFHVIPRMADQPVSRRGPAVFESVRAPIGEVSAEQADAVSAALQQHLEHGADAT
jgi:diadenosine tetraphosphate (Ap4A) HIT family hydrolase